MALNISAWSIRNPLPSVVFSIILLALGWVSFTKLAITRLPSADIPVISVAVSQFGAAPAELESQVTKTIEDGVSGVEGVRHISSSITEGLSLTTIQFTLETNTDRAIRRLAGAKTRDDLAGTMLGLPGGGALRLDDLGTVTDTIADRRTFARFNGEPVVALGIKRSKGASDVVVAAAVQKRIEALKTAYPDVDLKLIDTSVDFTKGNYEAAISTLFEGAILAVIIVFLFLRDIRATIIAAISLPLSIFPAFWAMDILGFSLNLVSFLAITLSTGILVDDAIVEIENIVRHMRMGKSPYRAALEAADEIGLAVIAISLTIIAIFTPASFMSGVAGQFFKQFGITVSVQVFFSLLAARLVTPVLAAYFMKDSGHHDPRHGRVLQAYSRLVTWSVRHYLITVLAGLAIFAASIWSIR